MGFHSSLCTLHSCPVKASSPLQLPSSPAHELTLYVTSDPAPPFRFLSNPCPLAWKHLLTLGLLSNLHARVFVLSCSISLSPAQSCGHGALYLFAEFRIIRWNKVFPQRKHSYVKDDLPPASCLSPPAPHRQSIFSFLSKQQVSYFFPFLWSHFLKKCQVGHVEREIILECRKFYELI